MRYLAVGLALALSGCSSFNLSPECQDTTEALLRILATDGSRAPDLERLRSLAVVEGIQETSSSYNERICRANIADEAMQATVVYRVRQAEGVRQWFDIEIINATDPSLVELSLRLRAAYGN